MKRRIGTSGTKRAERLAAEAATRERYPERRRLALLESAARRLRRDAAGLKRWFVPGTEFEGEGVLTPYARRERARRRAARRAARATRRRNR